MEEGRAGFDKNTYDLVILDLNLPDGNGLDFLKEIRKSSEIPVIILTAKDLEIDEVLGFELGANDYITKPFSLAILRARVNAQLNHHEDKSKYKKDLFSFDFDKMKFFVDDKEIELSKTEQKLLKLLIDNKGITLSREKILDYIWTDGGDFVYENTVSVTIKRLRDKLEEDSKNPKH
ncbi:MAG: response regulator transcription factor, partial [Neofamilia sp.]